MKANILKLGVLAIVAAGSLVAFRPAQAANPENVSATMTITAVRSLTVSTNNIQFDTPTVDDFNAGLTAEESMTATVISNDTWTLKVKGSDATWSSTGGWQSKPRSDIQFKSTSGAQDTFADLTGADQTLYSGTATTVSGETKTVTYRVKLSFANDTPGEYTYQNIVFTLGS